MAHFRRLVILGGVFLGSLGFLRAAEKAEPAQLTALWIDGRRPAGELFVADAKGQPQKLAVGVAGRGAPLSPGTPGKAIILLRKVPAAPAPAGSGSPGPAPSYEPAGEIAWPSGGAKKLLLLLASANKPGTPLSVRGVAIADDQATFPLGTLRFANFLGGELTSRVGESVKPLGAGASAAQPYPVEPKPDAKTIANFPVGLARAKDGKTELIFNGRVDAWPHSRTLLLVLPGASAEADPVVRTVVEVIAPPAAPAKPKAN